MPGALPVLEIQRHASENPTVSAEQIRRTDDDRPAVAGNMAGDPVKAAATAGEQPDAGGPRVGRDGGW